MAKATISTNPMMPTRVVLRTRGKSGKRPTPHYRRPPRVSGFRAVHVKLDEDLVDDGTATASVWSGAPGSRADTGENIEVSCWELEPGGTIAAGVYCTAAWIDGTWDVIKRSCA